MRPRRRWIWLGAAAVLFGLAAYLMAGGDEHEKKDAAPVAFPLRQNREERVRAERRRTLVAALAMAAVDAGHPRLRPADPVLAALPPKGPGASAIVLEANAIRNSPVGELLLDCLRARHHREDPLEQMRQQTGIDPTQDLDRMAMTNDGLLLSGNFANARWDTIFASAESSSAYGNQGTVYTFPTNPNSDRSPGSIGRWGNQMLIVGDSPAEVQTVIDRLEGRAPDAAPVLDEADTYGDVYGALDPADLAAMLPTEAGNLAEQLKAAAQQVKLHVDASNDVAMVADVSGPDAQQVSDLGKALGGAMALGRMNLVGDETQQQLLRDLLDQAKVAPGEGSFRAELALPLSVIQKRLGFCREGLDGGAPLATAAVPLAPEPPVQRTTSARMGP